jgi:hypothetical protein
MTKPYPQTGRDSPLVRLTARVRTGKVTAATLLQPQRSQLIVPLHRLVLRWHFGWTGGTSWTDEDIAAEIQRRSPYHLPLLTPEMVRTLLNHAAARVLHELGRFQSPTGREARGGTDKPLNRRP